MEKVFSQLIPVAERTGSVIIETVKAFGDLCVFIGETLYWSIRLPIRYANFFKQMEFIGVKSTSIIVLTGIFTGGVFALQTGKAFAMFNAEIMIGATIGLSLTRELSPVFTALMVTARACSSMAAELGTMKVTEQIDALHTMAVNPIHYLVVPRVFAATVMTPLLAMLFTFVGVIGSYVVAVHLLNIPGGPFMHNLYYYVHTEDLFGGLIKAAIFGFFVASISCYQGYVTYGGAEGVGRATTRAVVISSVTVLVMDYFLTSWILEYFTKRGPLQI